MPAGTFGTSTKTNGSSDIKFAFDESHDHAVIQFGDKTSVRFLRKVIAICPALGKLCNPTDKQPDIRICELGTVVTILAVKLLTGPVLFKFPG